MENQSAWRRFTNQATACPLSGLIFTLLLLLTLGSGCTLSPAARQPHPIPDAGAVVQRQATKDAVVISASERIDTVVSTSELAQPVREHTETIRAAVASAPAAEVATLSAQYTKIFEKQAADISRLEDKLAREAARARVAYQRWLRTAAAGLFLAFGVSLIFGRAAAVARTWPIAALGIGALVLAEVIGSIWFQIGSLILTALGAAYGVYWVIDRHRQGRLKAAVEKRAQLLREVVPVLDEAYEGANEELRRFLDRNIFKRLSDAFTSEDKATIHEIRKEATHG